MRIKEFTPSGAGNARGAGADELRNLDSNYSISNPSEAKNTFKHCIVCGSRFVPGRVNNSLCDQCLTYHQVGRAIESIRQLMAGVSHV